MSLEKIVKCILALLLMLISWNVNADEIFPPGCKAIVVEDQSVLLSTPKPAIIMIHNLSEGDVWITHPVADPSASAGWSSRLQGNNWSALALSEKSFELSCIESKPGHEQQVPCAGVLAVCKWSIKKMPQGVTGTYWAGEDMTLSALTAHITGRGFVLPKASK